MGISMKKVVRDLFWWPGISKAIDQIAANCPGCKKHRKRPPANTLSVWPFARRPMEHVHIDYFEYKTKQIKLHTLYLLLYLCLNSDTKFFLKRHLSLLVHAV